jgi:hypothetical protein
MRRSALDLRRAPLLRLPQGPSALAPPRLRASALPRFRAAEFLSGKGAQRLPQKKWGPALLPAPTAPSEGSAGVRNLVDRTFRTTDPLSILAHQLRRRFPSCSSLVRGANLTYLTAPPEGSLVFQSDRPAETSIRRPSFRRKPPDVLRPFLGNPLSRPASLTFLVLSEEIGGREPRRATGRFLFRRLFPAGPEKNPKVLPMPAGGDRSFCRLPRPSCRFRPSGEAGTSVPITWSPCTSVPSRKSKKCGEKPVDNGDIGNNSRNSVTNRPMSPDSRLARVWRGCCFVPLRLPRPSA